MKKVIVDLLKLTLQQTAVTTGKNNIECATVLYCADYFHYPQAPSSKGMSLIAFNKNIGKYLKIIIELFFLCFHSFFDFQEILRFEAL